MEFLEPVLASKSDCSDKPQPFLISNFSSCVVVLDIFFKKNHVEENKHFVNKV